MLNELVAVPLQSLGKVEGMCGDIIAARQTFEQAISTIGPNQILLNQWAALEQQQKDITAARAVFDRLEQHAGGNHNHVPALGSQAPMEHRAGSADKALRLYKEALKQEPHSPKVCCGHYSIDSLTVVQLLPVQST